MPRRTLLDAADSLHHVIIRGIEPIFTDDRDQEEFVERCMRVFPETISLAEAGSGKRREDCAGERVRHG